MKVSILIPHYNTWKWTAICIDAFKRFPTGIEQEIIVCDNSPNSASIKCLTDTSLGEGITIVKGDTELPSHGHGYELCLEKATGDYIFTSESDSFPTHKDWFKPYLEKMSEGYDLVGPEVPQSSGRYLHPAGALYSRKLIDSASKWVSDNSDWWFCPGKAVTMGLSDKGYHVVAHESIALKGAEELAWRKAGVFQEMRCFDEDTFDNFSRRVGITNWEPVGNQRTYLKIGFEAGQWLSYFAQSKGFKWFKAPMNLVWMQGHEGGQAAYSTVFEHFTHVWCGTSSFCPGIPESVKSFKMNQMNSYWNALPETLRSKIDELERSSDNK